MGRKTAFLIFLLLANGAFALDARRALTQARLSVWTSDAGLPQNTTAAEAALYRAKSRGRDRVEAESALIA